MSVVRNPRFPLWAAGAVATLLILPTAPVQASETAAMNAHRPDLSATQLTSPTSLQASVSAAVAAPPEAVPYIQLFGYQPQHYFFYPAVDGADSYTSEWSSDGLTWTPTDTQDWDTFTHTFAPGTYQVRVRAENIHGPGPYTTSIPFSVGPGFVRPVPLDHRISRLYLAAFQRQPDDHGFFAWYGEHIDGTPLHTIANGFTNSAEFQATYGTLDNTQFVELLYQNVFGRALDPTGRAGWVGLLDNGGTRGQVLAGLSNSPEFIAATGTVPPSTKIDGSINRLYLASFKRVPGAAEVSAWRNQLYNGQSLESMANYFVNSAEFTQSYGSLTNVEYVDLLFHHTRFVQADVHRVEERAEWIARLDSGWSRGDVMLAFSEDHNFIHRTGTAP